MVVVDDNVINLIKKGNSINEISKITGLGKSTIYFHYRKIKGKKTKVIKFHFSEDEEIGEFIGIFAGDGSFYKRPKTYHYVIRIYTGFYEKEYADFLMKRFTIWFGKKPSTYLMRYKKRPSAIVNYYYSKEIYEFIKKYLEWDGKKTYSVRLKNFNLKNEKFNIGFIKGLIDTDGSYYKQKRRLSFSSVSKRLAEQAFEIIKNLIKKEPKMYIIKDKSNKRSTLYTITLHGDNAKDLIDIIKPNNINKRQ